MSTNLLYPRPSLFPFSFLFPSIYIPYHRHDFQPLWFGKNFASREQKSGREWVFKILFLWVVKS